jgi:hypothetical protein
VTDEDEVARDGFGVGDTPGVGAGAVKLDRVEGGTRGAPVVRWGVKELIWSRWRAKGLRRRGVTIKLRLQEIGWEEQAEVGYKLM